VLVGTVLYRTPFAPVLPPSISLPFSRSRCGLEKAEAEKAKKQPGTGIERPETGPPRGHYYAVGGIACFAQIRGFRQAQGENLQRIRHEQMARSKGQFAPALGIL
jgi:hypothetical protein